MLNTIKRFMKSLGRSTSGNVLILFAAGAPVFIGGAGLAVDTAQWYMWKREMQYAVDQAALAGAWSKVGGTTGEEYKTRAQQEITANLQVVNFQGTPSITLADYGGKTNNSVLVSLSASKELPFSKLLMKSGTTITVSAQAKFEKALTYTACLIAVDPSAKGAITFNGNAYLVARCGVAALSNNASAITNGGNGTFNVGYLITAGGVDDSLEGTFTRNGVTYTNYAYEGVQGLVDPFAALTPPSNTTPRTYVCASGATTTTATYDFKKTVVDKTYTSPTNTSSSTWTYQSPDAAVSSATQTGLTTTTAPAGTKRGDTLASPSPTVVTGSVATVPGSAAVPKSGCNKQGVSCTNPGSPATPTTFKRVDRVTTELRTVTAVTSSTAPGGAQMLPGTYTSFNVGCDTTMAAGVYVIDGGRFTIHSQDSISGQGVMIVLKNGAGIDVNGGSNMNLRPMTEAEMIDARYGNMTLAEAQKLKDMLIFEDRNSPGATNANTFNGNASAKLEGTIYLPKSAVTLDGTLSVTSRCLVITAKTISIQGGANMTSLCPAGTADHTGGAQVASGAASVKLVA